MLQGVIFVLKNEIHRSIPVIFIYFVFFVYKFQVPLEPIIRSENPFQNRPNYQRLIDAARPKHNEGFAKYRKEANFSTGTGLSLISHKLEDLTVRTSQSQILTPFQKNSRPT